MARQGCIQHDEPWLPTRILPADVLEVVLEFVDDPQLLAACRLVAARWRDAVRGMLRFVSGRDDTSVVYGRGAVACRVGLERAQQWSRLCIVAFAATLEALLFPRELCPPPHGADLAAPQNAADRSAVAQRHFVAVKALSMHAGTAKLPLSRCCDFPKLRRLVGVTLRDRFRGVHGAPPDFVAAVLLGGSVGTSPAPALEEFSFDAAERETDVDFADAIGRVCPCPANLLRVTDPPLQWLRDLPRRSPLLRECTLTAVVGRAMPALDGEAFAHVHHLRRLSLSWTLSLRSLWDLCASLPPSLEHLALSTLTMSAEGTDHDRPAAARWPTSHCYPRLESLSLKLPGSAQAGNADDNDRGSDSRRTVLETLVQTFQSLRVLKLDAHRAFSRRPGFVGGPASLVSASLEELSVGLAAAEMLSLGHHHHQHLSAVAAPGPLPRLRALDVALHSWDGTGGGNDDDGVCVADVAGLLRRIEIGSFTATPAAMRTLSTHAVAAQGLCLKFTALQPSEVDSLSPFLVRLTELSMCLAGHINTATDFAALFRAIPNATTLGLEAGLDADLVALTTALDDADVIAAVPQGLTVVRIGRARYMRESAVREQLLVRLLRAAPPTLREIHIASSAHVVRRSGEVAEHYAVPNPWPASVRLFCSHSLIDPAARRRLVKQDAVDLDAFYPL